MPNTVNLALISSHGNLFSRNKPLFQGDFLNVTLVCCDADPLQGTDFVDEIIIFQSHEKCGGSAQNLIENQDVLQKLPEFVLFEDDDWLYQISRSNLDDELKSKLLPIKNPKYFEVAGSKISQIQLFSELGIPHPTTQIYDISMSERLTIPFPFIAKGERRSGGVEVAFIENNRQLEEFTHKQNHKFLIQENIIGNELNADAFYRNGKLIFVAFSSTKFAMWKFGPFARRDYARKIPNEVSENLQLIGEKLQFNGIANVTFMKDSKNKNLKLFEFDARLNVWAHVSILFGFDPQEFYRNSTAMNFTNPMGKVFVNRPRFNKYLDDTYGNRVTLKRLHLLKTKIRVFISGGSFTD